MIKSLKPDPGFWSKTSWIQIFYGIWVNLSMVGAGLIYGISTQTFAKSRNFSLELFQSIWFSILYPLLFPIGSIVCGLIMDKFGRRSGLVLSQIPFCIGWLCTSFEESSFYITIGFCLHRFGTGMVVGAPRMYTTEISLPNMRAVLSSFSNLALVVGFLIQVNFGYVHSWSVTCHACNLYSGTVLLLNCFLPETPYFVLLGGNIEKTKKALQKFRSKNYHIEQELGDLNEFKTDNEMKRLSLWQSFLAMVKISACKPFSIIMTYVLIGQLTGQSVMFMWEVTLIKGLETVDATLGNIILSTMKILSALLTTVLFFHLGRRPLSFISGLGVGMICLILGGIILNEEIKWVTTIIFYCGYILFGAIGLNNLPILMMYEMYPLQVRGIFGGVTFAVISILMLGVNKLYPYIHAIIGYGISVLCFGVFSILGCIFLYFCLPETGDLTLPEIEEYYNQRRPSLVSEKKIISAQKIVSITANAVKIPNSQNRYYPFSKLYRNLLHFKEFKTKY